MHAGSIVVTRPIPRAGLALLEEAEVTVEVLQTDEERPVDRDALLSIRADVLLCLLTDPIDGEVLRRSGVRGVANYAVGYNNIDVAAATELGIPVSNTPGVLTEASADCTWAMLLAVARRIPQAHRYTVEGRFKLWGANLFLGSDVGPGPDGRRKVLGVVGFGRIGQAVARRATGFDMEVLAFDPVRQEGVAEFVELPELLARSDFICLHPPLNEATRHLIGEEELRAMKRGAFLINAARGPVVDEVALVRALREGWIAGAALDVYEDEPRLSPGLAELDNVVLLPHILSASHDTRGRMAEIAARNALCHLRLEHAPEVVNPEVYESEAWIRRGA
jgi:glyoxylate reductase